MLLEKREVRLQFNTISLLFCRFLDHFSPVWHNVRRHKRENEWSVLQTERQHSRTV